MNTVRNSRVPYLLTSIPLFVFLVYASCRSLLTEGFYSQEQFNWQIQSLGQDMVDLFVVAPTLLLSTFFSYRNNLRAIYIWAGTNLYLVYTFVLYCFDVHFNELFLIYCICLGLSFYSFLYFLFSHITAHSLREIQTKPRAIHKWVGIYFTGVAMLFYLLWLSEIVPSLVHHTTPKSIEETGLFTNGVHVLDLAIILPAIFMIGVIMLKRNTIGIILAPPILTFFILMDITIAVLAYLMNAKGLGEGYSLILVMGILALFSMILLTIHLRTIKTVGQS